MREIFNLNAKWAFSKEATKRPAAMPEKWYWVNLPHSWNAIDGQDGGGDYYRGICYYAKSIDKIDLPEARRYFLEVNGANHSAKVYWNGHLVGSHQGGYSTWRVDVTEAMANSNFIVFEVDNSLCDNVYPQNADFTFYGGLYRDVNLICVPESHFELEYYGTPGIKVTPVMNGNNANVEVEVWTKNADGKALTYSITDAEGNVIAEAMTTEKKASFVIENVHKWHGRKDPYLYTATVKLEDLDTVSARFGCRSFAVDPDRGFILNGEEYPLRGVSRHQDRWGIGNALLPQHQEEDMAMIMEIGATTIRLAHYQHNQYFYDLCDAKGQIIWTEIPYITTHMRNGKENTIQQMKELIIQNYNHPSIVVWGLSNEINAGYDAEEDADIMDNHKQLNDLVHRMDDTRLTTLAAITSCPTDHPYLEIPDIVSYNQYFGWYGGTIETYSPWFDKFHADHPNLPIGISEYGCEALNWHNSNPDAGDYSEEYQALYHESLIRQIAPRKYLWATHVWNMFDFAADARNEGGEAGQNHKGLVTFDRKYKKDAFYAYKAWLSDEPFVHLCGKRYIDRTEDMTRVTVYSNLPAVELFANGVSLGIKEAPDHFFYFEVPNVGETKLVAVADECRDESMIRKVSEPNPAYILMEKGAVLNWWDIIHVDGHADLNTKLATVVEAAGAERTLELLTPILAEGAYPETLSIMDAMTVLRMINVLTGFMGIPVTKDQLMILNAELNKIQL